MSDFEDKRIFLIGGPGGVGKTTLAASLAIELAKQGHRTVVLTVDPAKRLAQALGFDSFHKELQKVEIKDAKGELFASMLDTKHYFDKLIARFAGSEQQKQRILEHPIYRTMVESLGGTHEYAAMERLLEFAEDKSYDKIVIDTPPSQNAIDLLTAPQRLADFMDNSVLKWFQGNVPGYLKLFRTGTKMAMKLLQSVFGAEFLNSFASFLDNLEGMQSGFRQRHLEVIALLGNPKTAFLLVTAATGERYRESLAFLKKIEEQKIHLNALVLNRLEPACPPATDPAASGLNGSRPLVDAILSYYSALHAQQQEWVASFEKALPELPVIRIPKQSGSLHEVTTLSKLGGLLLNSLLRSKDDADNQSRKPTQTTPMAH
ncbi:MAG: ArsA family ATPase [Bdellovibrionaceae bacterium]|nr:ArsA family ATPase [Pseudobdellovibrionaceae bacterium]